jgi:hypothetical protein
VVRFLRALFVLLVFLLGAVLGVVIVDDDGSGTAGTSGKDECTVSNASGKAGGEKIKPPVVLETDAGSLNRTVNIGSDREEEVISLRVDVPKGLKKRKLVKRMELVAEPFTKTHETAESASITDIKFSKLDLSGDGKRIAFLMCVDPPSGLDAGKYTSVVTLEGPPGMVAATMTVTLNGKDGGTFLTWLLITAAIAFLALLYKGASEKRSAAIAEAEKETDDAERDAALKKAERWWASVWSCLKDPGWLVPTIAAVVGSFGALWAIYDNNPAWGENGAVTSGLALIGAGLTAVGVKTIFTRGSGTS